MTGAARLAARAAQRMGAGLVTLATTPESAPIYQQAFESVIVRVASDVQAWKLLIDDPKRDAILIGPGLGLGTQEKTLVRVALESRKPCILDADALTNFADDPDALLARLHHQCVLTPHEGEFARIFGAKISADLDKTSRARMAAKIAGCVVLLKGSETIIAVPDGRIIRNNNAPPWLATAGSGDVLAGMILGLVTQNMPIPMATAAAAWLHGDIANHLGRGLIAEDLVAGIPEALQKLTATAA